MHLWPLLSFSNFSNDGPLIMFLPNTFVKLSDNFRKKIISESPQWFCRKSQLWQEVYSAHLQLWTSNAQVIKTRQQAIELHGLVTWKYSVAQRVVSTIPEFKLISKSHCFWDFKVKHQRNLQFWLSNAQVIKTRQLVIELHGLVTCKYSMAQTVCNCPKVFFLSSFVA